MKKKDLITKWLNNEPLTKLESETFEQLDVFESYMKISETAKRFQAPMYDMEENLQVLTRHITYRKHTIKKKSYLPVLMKIAAIFILAIGIYFSFFKDYNTVVTTLASEKSTIELPDNSSVTLNAGSSIVYNEKNWSDQRKVTLEGEAYFKVAKGKKFDVHTSSGIISVLGTQFNVKQRNDFFEVNCFEGLVNVTFNNKTIALPAGNVFKVLNGKISTTSSFLTAPDWKDFKSSFTSAPYSMIIAEFERQYNVTIITENIDKTTLFTGNFVHSDIETALQAITIPMRLKYVINNKNVTLYKD